jgi:7,8-dihydropterin-6-yl-methyl-4-(beta-D-ribofuranosyl)aminobenzene 5'-phosphate synthase
MEYFLSRRANPPYGRFRRGDAREGAVMPAPAITVKETDRMTVRIVTDNYYDSLRRDTAVATRCRVSSGRSVHAEHGLAIYIETCTADAFGACMFDFGLDAAGVMNNMNLMGIDPGKASAFALSHGHLDHWTGAPVILRCNRDRIPPGTPFYVGKEAFLRRYSLRPDTGGIADIGRLDREDIEATGVRILETAEPTEIIPGLYLTGAIERTTPYEIPSESLLVERNGEIVSDDFRGEQALFCNVRNKGLVVLSGCAHAGIVNTVRHALKITGAGAVHAILGGFHLIHAAPEKIRNTIDDIRAMKPDFVAPMHCTGFEALAAFSAAMPDAFILNTAGTEYRFDSDPQNS